VDFASSQLLNTQAHSDMEEACTACIIALPLLLPFKLRNSEQGRAGQGRAGQGRAGQGRAGQGRAGQGRMSEAIVTTSLHSRQKS